MLTALQPVLRQKMLEAARRRMIARLERRRNSRVILLVHRQGTMNLLGFPMFRYIDIHDSEEILRAIQMTDDDVPIDLILHTHALYSSTANRTSRLRRGGRTSVA